MNSGEGGQVVPLHGTAASKRRRGTDPGGSTGPAGAARRARRTPEVRRTPPADPTGIELTYTHQHLWSSNGEDTPEVWHVSADALPGDGDPAGGSHVGDIEIVLANPYTPDAFSLLDGYSADLGNIGGIVLDVASGGLDPDFEETLEGPGSDLLILDSIQLTQQWRGFGIGVLLAGLAIRRLRRGCSAAVCTPAPLPPLDDPEQDRAAHAALGAVWSQLGFTEFRRGVYAVDLALVTLDSAIERLDERIARY